MSNKIMTQGNSVLPYTLLVLATPTIIQRMNNILPWMNQYPVDSALSAA